MRNYELSIINEEWGMRNYELRSTNYEVPITKYEVSTTLKHAITDSTYGRTYPKGHWNSQKGLPSHAATQQNVTTKPTIPPTASPTPTTKRQTPAKAHQSYIIIARTCSQELPNDSLTNEPAAYIRYGDNEVLTKLDNSKNITDKPLYNNENPSSTKPQLS